MKRNLFAVLGAVAAFTSCGLITYKLLNCRRTSGSFHELYEDNLAAMKGGDDQCK